MNVTELVARDQRHIWHPFTQAATAPAPLPIVRAEGAWLQLEDGRRILDAVSSWWTNLHGHAHPRIVDAIATQVAELDHVMFASCTHPKAVEVAERLVVASPAGLDRVFFSDSGSTAVEIALKMAFQYWFNRGQPQKQRFVAMELAYHGDTVGAMSAGDSTDFFHCFEPLFFPVQRVPTASCHQCPVGLTRDTCKIDCMAKLESLLKAQGDQIAAVIMEPMVHGAGGMVIQPVEFLRGVADLCRAHDVLFIADEVMTGFGRTGRMFACEHADVRPDIMCLAKGLSGGVLPLAATLATEAIYEAFLDEDRRRAFLHGHSFTANPIACAAAAANLEIFDTEPVLERIAALQAVYEDRLPPLARHPRVHAVRWLGSIGAVELASPTSGYFSDIGPRLYEGFLRRGILSRPLGPVVYTIPPYCIEPDDLRGVFDALEELLGELDAP